MSDRPAKPDVLRALRTRLTETLARLAAAQAAAQAGAVHVEAKQEHAKDMRSTEAGYLSRGLAGRVEDLADDLRRLEGFAPRARSGADAAIALGDLAGVVDADGVETIYFIAPVGGGEKVVLQSGPVSVVTPGSPLGEALMEHHAGDEINLELRGGKRSLEIVWVE